ncbi:DUF4011 domain-containing protein [Sphaerisporangium viridialbum]|uniref:DUF4011 domain-containing protein n=1 Tax=Sphaerisporangium viridialbum TaxID=46189 RepID=UPI003C756C19
MSIETQAANRRTLVERAAERWRKDLRDFGYRNTLLFYKDLKRGTLDLSAATVEGLTSLFAGRIARPSKLFRDPQLQADAGKRLQTIYKKVKELREERGIQAGYLAVGLATWTDERTSATPCAPVVLRAIDLERKNANDLDMVMRAAPEVEINPSLLSYLNERFDLQIEVEDFTGLLPEPDATFDPEFVFDRLSKLADGVPGFAIHRRSVVGTFSYAKLPMVKDLEDSIGAASWARSATPNCPW